MTKLQLTNLLFYHYHEEHVKALAVANTKSVKSTRSF